MKSVFNILILVAISISTNIYAKENKTYKLSLATTWGSTAKPVINASLNMAKYAKEMSNGQLIIKIDFSNKHKAPLGVFDMVKNGQYDMAHTASYYWKGKDIDLFPFAAMPFGMTASELYAWFYYGDGLKLMQKAYAKHNILSFPGGNSGVQMGGWFKKEINSIQDFKGLKMRIPGFAGEVLSKVGVLVTNIPPSELYTSLERNTIDALEWVSPAMDIKMGFHKVAPYYYTAWHEASSETQFLVNKKVFEKLPVHLQKILKNAMKLAAYDLYIEIYHLNAKALKKMNKDYPNIKIRTLPKKVLNKLKGINRQLRKEVSKKSELLKEILDSQEKYMKDVRKWTEMSDYAYFKDNIDD